MSLDRALCIVSRLRPVLTGLCLLQIIQNLVEFFHPPFQYVPESLPTGVIQPVAVS